MTILNSPILSVAYNGPNSSNRLVRPRVLWNLRTLSPRSLQQDSNPTDQYAKASNSSGTSTSAEESPVIDDKSINDEIDNNSNDDVTVVVPLNLERGENVDDGFIADKEESLSSITTPNGDDGMIASGSQSGSVHFSKQNRVIFWACLTAVVCLIAGYVLYRRREHSRWREYRTHRILQEQVDAFDLNFRDDDDIELSDFQI